MLHARHEGSAMFFDIEPDSGVPIYEQVVSQIVFAVASGALEPGALIPSVRDLGQRLVVHPNTVARAFQELERMGVVAARRGRGMEVTDEAPALCRRSEEHTSELQSLRHLVCRLLL